MDDFDRFVATVQPRLQIALVATFGPTDGRTATVDALSWAWEHWDQVATMGNPVGYLYRVGQSAVRRLVVRPFPVEALGTPSIGGIDVDVDLSRALGQLPERQRTTVLLVHAFGWTLRDVGELLGLAPSTVRVHTERALSTLLSHLEVSDVC